MFKSVLRSSILVTSLLFITGCVNGGNDALVQENDRVQTTKQHLEVAADMQKNVTTQNTLEATIASLAAQMLQNKKMDTNKPVLITSFVKLDEFKKTTEFGRVISESLINELSNRGFNIIEFRGQMAVSINDEGEYFISRKPHELKNKIPNTYVVVGTYSRQAGKTWYGVKPVRLTSNLPANSLKPYTRFTQVKCWLTTARLRSTGRKTWTMPPSPNSNANSARWATSTSSSLWLVSTPCGTTCSTWHKTTSHAACRPMLKRCKSQNSQHATVAIPSYRTSKKWALATSTM